MNPAIVLTLICAAFIHTAMSDTPYTPKGKGANVVAEVTSSIQSSGIFPSDNKFMCRVAWVESKYGYAPGTYRANYYGGIWQVDSVGFSETKKSTLRKYHEKIKTQFGIDWANTEWSDLLKPMYSGLAARLYLARIPAAIPQADDIWAQGQYWKTYYNTVAGKGTVEKFVSDVKQASGCAV